MVHPVIILSVFLTARYSNVKFGNSCVFYPENVWERYAEVFHYTIRSTEVPLYSVQVKYYSVPYSILL